MSLPYLYGVELDLATVKQMIDDKLLWFNEPRVHKWLLEELHDWIANNGPDLALEYSDFLDNLVYETKTPTGLSLFRTPDQFMEGRVVTIPNNRLFLCEKQIISPGYGMLGIKPFKHIEKLLDLATKYGKHPPDYLVSQTNL